MKRLIRRGHWSALAAITALVCFADTARAHPIHTTLTVVTVDAGVTTFRVRAFADDFSAVVARFAGRAAPRDSTVADADIDRYLATQFTATDAQGRSIPLMSCGVRRERELYWICLKTLTPSARGIQLRNRVLTELHADQVNIVQVDVGGGRRTTLFTRESPAESIL